MHRRWFGGLRGYSHKGESCPSHHLHWYKPFTWDQSLKDSGALIDTSLLDFYSVPPPGNIPFSARWKATFFKIKRKYMLKNPPTYLTVIVYTLSPVPSSFNFMFWHCFHSVFSHFPNQNKINPWRRPCTTQNNMTEQSSSWDGFGDWLSS